MKKSAVAVGHRLMRDFYSEAEVHYLRAMPIRIADGRARAAAIIAA